MEKHCSWKNKQAALRDPHDKRHKCGEMDQLLKKVLQSSFDVLDVKGVDMREQERHTNREILTRLIDLTGYLAQQGQALDTAQLW